MAATTIARQVVTIATGEQWRASRSHPKTKCCKPCANRGRTLRRTESVSNPASSSSCKGDPMSKRLIALGGLLVSACAPMLWNKPGASQNDFSRDRYTCVQQAQQRVAGAQVNAYGGTASNTVVTN